MPRSALPTGLTARRNHVVGSADTAAALGSGSLAVLATPRLLAWLEAATCAAIDPSLDEAETSVGTRVSIEQLSASPVGAQVEVEATVQYVDGRLVRFEAVATGAAGVLLGRAEITRVVVEEARFLARLT